MKIIDVDVGSLDTPEKRKRALEEIDAKLGDMPPGEKAKALRHAVEAIEAMSQGKSPEQVNLGQTHEQLTTMLNFIETLRLKLQMYVPEGRSAAFQYGGWDTMLIIAGGALSTVVNGMRARAGLEPLPEDEPPS